MSVSTAKQIDRPTWLFWAVAMGISSPILFLLIVVLGAAARPEYSHIAQAISELTMADAPNRFLLASGIFVVDLMTIVFGLGYYRVARDWGRAFRISAILMVFIGVAGLLFAPFPQDPVGGELTTAGSIHIALAAVSSLASMAVIGFAAVGWRGRPNGKAWSVYSFASFAIVFLTGLLSMIAITQDWSNVGLWQRLSVAAFLSWKVLLAFYLLRQTREV